MIRHYDHGGCGAMSGMFQTLARAAQWCKDHGYTVKHEPGNAEFRYFDADGTEIGGFYR